MAEEAGIQIDFPEKVVIAILTYQGLEAVGSDETKRMDFIRQVVADHKASPEYKIAADAEQYYAKKNVTISKFQKLLYDAQGCACVDLFSANYKLKTGFFRRFVTQQVQYVLSNGVIFEDKATKSKLGNAFDNQLQKAAKKAMVDGVAFGFWNLDHLEVFSFADTPKEPGFAPLYDEDNGLLRAGVRYWNPKSDESARYTLYEMDGYTEYIQRKAEDMKAMSVKKPYMRVSKKTEFGGVEEVQGSNYSGFPIIPIYANDLKESEIIGIRESIDCYDFIKSGLANDIDDTSGFYWILKNVGGMDDTDVTAFLERMRVVRAQALPDGAEAEAHTLNIPTEARSTMLDRLRNDLYEDFMLMDTEKALSGNMTATAIRLAYQTQDDKCGDFEFCIREFIAKLFDLLGIESEPSFNWNRIANQTEETQMVMTAATYLDDEAVLKHLPWLTQEEVDEILERKDAEGLDRLSDEESEGQLQGGEEDVAGTGEAVEAAEETVGKTLNGSQTSSLITVIRQLGAGTITEGQAVNIIVTALGVTREEALKIIRGEE